jgi:CRISPR-associated protein Csb1
MMTEQTQAEVNANAWDELLDEETGPAAIVIRERLRPATGCGTAIAPPTFAPSGRGKSDYHCDGEDPQNWPAVLQAVAAGRVVNRCTLDSIPSQANRMEGHLKRFEGTSIPKVTLTGVKGESMSLLDVGHRVADAALWSAENYDDFQKALEAYVRGDAGRLARLAPTSLVFGYWDSRGTTGGKARRLVRSEIFAENVVRLTRKSQYWASVDPEASEDLKKALEEAKAKAKDDEEKDVGSQLGFRDAPASGLGGVIAHGEITRLTILSLTGLRNLSVRLDEKEKALDDNEQTQATRDLRRYLLALMLAAATSTKAGWDLREGCLLVQQRKPKDGEKDGISDIAWTKVFHDGREEPWTTPPAAPEVKPYLSKTAEEFFKTKPEGNSKFPSERNLTFNAGTAAQRVREKLAGKDQTKNTTTPGATKTGRKKRG